MIRLAPASSEAVTLAAGSALRLGRNAEALDYLRRVDPERGLLLFWPVYWTMTAKALHALGRQRDEVAAARRGLRQFPSAWSMRLALVTALAASGDYDAAMAAGRDPVPGEAYPEYEAAGMSAVTAGELRGHGHAAAAQRLLDSLADHPVRLSADSSHWAYERKRRSEILYQAGRWAAADSVLRPLDGHFSDEIEVTGRLATIAARLGHRADAERISEALRTRPPGYLHGRQTFWRAHIAAALGERETAVILLRDAHAQGYPITDEYGPAPHVDRDFAELLNDPAFIAITHPE